MNAVLYPDTYISLDSSLSAALLYFDQIYLTGWHAIADEGSIHGYIKIHGKISDITSKEFQDYDDLKAQAAIHCHKCYVDFIKSYRLLSKEGVLIPFFLKELTKKSIFTALLSQFDLKKLDEEGVTSEIIANSYLNTFDDWVARYLKATSQEKENSDNSKKELQRKGHFYHPKGHVIRVGANNPLLPEFYIGYEKNMESVDDKSVVGHLAQMAIPVVFALQTNTPLITDHASHNTLLSSLIRVIREKEHNNYRENIDKKSYLLAKAVMNRHLPYVRFKSFESILYVRDQLSEELEDFRLEMRSLASTIQSEQYSLDFKAEIENILSQKIDKKIHNLRKALKTPSKIILKHIDTKSLATGTVALVGSVFAGLTPIQQILIPTLVSILHTSIQAKIELNKIKNNPLSFVISLEKSLDK